MKTVRVRAVEGRPVNALDAQGRTLTREVGRYLSGAVMPEGEELPEPLHPLYRTCLASGDLEPWEPPAEPAPAPAPEPPSAPAVADATHTTLPGLPALPPASETPSEPAPSAGDEEPAR